MPCYNPKTIKVNEDQYIPVDCRKCIGCIKMYAQTWSIRCIHEKAFSKKSCFITLTYDSYQMPDDGKLNHTDFQLFMKRLRRKFEGIKVRYFMTGEYGERNDRPHYHAILFGVDFKEDRIAVKRKKGYFIYRSELLEGLWKKGFCSLGDVSSRSVSYVAKYQLYKMDARENKHYMKCSKRPGLGALWCDEYLGSVIERGYIVHDKKKYSIPKYYINRVLDPSLKIQGSEVVYGFTSDKIYDVTYDSIMNYKNKRIEYIKKIEKEKIEKLGYDYLKKEESFQLEYYRKFNSRYL